MNYRHEELSHYIHSLESIHTVSPGSPAFPGLPVSPGIPGFPGLPYKRQRNIIFHAYRIVDNESPTTEQRVIIKNAIYKY